MRWDGAPLPETFTHTAHGSPEEDGLVFAFRWLAESDPLDGFALPYRQTIARAYVAMESTSNSAAIAAVNKRRGWCMCDATCWAPSTTRLAMAHSAPTEGR